MIRDDEVWLELNGDQLIFVEPLIDPFGFDPVMGPEPEV
jgi:hypothetical protein